MIPQIYQNFNQRQFAKVKSSPVLGFYKQNLRIDNNLRARLEPLNRNLQLIMFLKV